MTFSEWVQIWYPALDLERSTRTNYRNALKSHIMSTFGHLALARITPLMINTWERSITDAGYAVSTARTARAVLSTALDDAVRAGHIPSNPAVRPRGKGKKATRRIEAFEQAEKVWPTPFEGLLIAERAALVSGRWEDFVMILTSLFTGLRWSEVLALIPDSLRQRGLITTHWKLYEDGDEGGFYWGRPKDGSMRAVEVPEWLWTMLKAIKPRRCACSPTAAAPFCQGREVLFLGSRTHHRRSAWGRLYMRPAADGLYPAHGGRSERPVLADASASWPGEPLEPWPKVAPGAEFVRPVLRHITRQTPRPINSRTLRADLIAYAIEQGADPAVVARSSREALLRAYVYPSGDALVSWLPVREGLTFHGLRHGHQTMMDNGNVKPALKVQRMGHTDFTMSARYGHVTDEMVAELLALLDAVWETALRRRFEISPRSAVALLDEALQGLDQGAVVPLFSQNSPKTAEAISPA
ncbi:tyrosine-type recombinase/integrase [Streptosporangium saharense]|uniref:tyrosine-type recombinase/integrase n=1 Tax=Streptosporangium saharense TaxID=1706840 RepID=UPI003683AA6D